MITRSWIAGAITVLVFLLTLSVPLYADDDTLRDLGMQAAPGDIPKWDGRQWQDAHDNGITTLNTGPGLIANSSPTSVTLSVDFGGTGSSRQAAHADHVHPGLIPIGSVIAWLKSYPNTPALMEQWVECNGQILNDSESPYNGQTIPDLNGQQGGLKRFLRGSITSGAMAGSETHNHSRNSATGSGHYVMNYEDANHLPPYYEVVWIIRIK